MGLFRWEERKMRGRKRGIDKKKGEKTAESTAFCYLRIENYPHVGACSVLRAQQNKAGESAERTT